MGMISLESLPAFDPTFVAGLTAGCAVGIIALLIVLWVSVRQRRAGRCREVCISGERGDLVISVQAVREFVGRMVARFHEASLHSVTMRQHRNALNLRITLDVLPDAKVEPLAEQIRDTVIREAAEQLGLRMEVRVDIVVRNLSASEKRIARAARRSGVPAAGSGGGGEAASPALAERRSVPLAGADKSDAGEGAGREAGAAG